MTKSQRPLRRGLKTYMSGREYRAILAARGLSVRKAAKFLRIDQRTSSRRANDQAPIGWDTAALLRLMAHFRLKPQVVETLTNEGVADQEQSCS